MKNTGSKSGTDDADHGKGGTNGQAARSGAGSMSAKVTIASEVSASRDVQKRILDQVEHFEYNPNAIFAIKLALEEASMNAIKHGNKNDKNKKVHFEWRITPHLTEIIVEDEGPGFVKEAVPDPTQDENLERCSGRGILLIEAYMNEVEYSNGGRRLRMVKRNEPEPSAT
jgi:serine/threonine-protein kinase RsbW